MMAFRLCNVADVDDDEDEDDEMTMLGIDAPPPLAKSWRSRKGAGKMEPEWWQMPRRRALCWLRTLPPPPTPGDWLLPSPISCFFLWHFWFPFFLSFWKQNAIEKERKKTLRWRHNPIDRHFLSSFDSRFHFFEMIVMIFFAVVSSRTENSSFAVLHLLFNMSVSLSFSLLATWSTFRSLFSLSLCLSLSLSLSSVELWQ